MLSRRNRTSNGESSRQSSHRPTPRRDAPRSQVSDDAESDVDVDADADTGLRPSNRSRIFGVSYQEMIGPPTIETADDLASVANSRDTQRITDNSCAAIQGISDAIVAINDALLEQRKAIARQQRRSKQADKEDLELWGANKTEERDAYLQQSRQQADDALQALVEASLDLTQQGEELTREMIDVMVDAEDFHHAITEAADQIRSEARMRKAIHQSALQEARAARQAAEAADEPAPAGLAQTDDEEDATSAPFVTLRNALNAKVQGKVEVYSAQSAYQRYATHNEYAAFKRYVHRSIYEDSRDLPDKKRWFDRDGLPVLPTREVLLGQEDDEVMADGSDDELVIQRVKHDYKCPLSLRELVDPWKNTKCNHVYEKQSIFDLLAQSHRNMVQCPVVACSVSFTRQDLVPDREMLFALERRKRRQARHESDSEEDEEMDDHEYASIDSPPVGSLNTNRQGSSRPFKPE